MRNQQDIVSAFLSLGEVLLTTWIPAYSADAHGKANAGMTGLRMYLMEKEKRYISFFKIKK